MGILPMFRGVGIQPMLGNSQARHLFIGGTPMLSRLVKGGASFWPT